MMGEVSAYLNRFELSVPELPVTPGQLAQLVNRVADDTLSSKTAKALFETLWDKPTDAVDQRIEELGLAQMSDSGELAAIVAQVLEAHPDQLQQLRDGKDKVLGFLVGQVMKATQGKANPKEVNTLIREQI